MANQLTFGCIFRNVRHVRHFDFSVRACDQEIPLCAWSLREGTWRKKKALVSVFPLMYLDQMNHGNLKIEYFKFLLKGTV